MQVELKTVVPPKVQRGFEITRRKLVETLSELVFMRVKVITFPESVLRKGTHFQGEAEEVFPGRTQQHHRRPRMAFFSRYSRSQGLSILGTFQIVDCPIGPSHSSAIPQVGDILVGSLISTEKGKIPFELRGWSNNAKPLLELSRIAQYGTRMSEKELVQLLRQPGSLAANIYLRLHSNLLASEKILAEKSAQAADDLWCLTRIICFGRLDDDKTLKTSKDFTEIVDNLAIKYADEELLEAWTKVRPQEYKPEENFATYAPSNYSAAYTSDPNYPQFNPVQQQYIQQQKWTPAEVLSRLHAQKPPAYHPTSPILPTSSVQTSSTVPTSSFVPTSPPYHPTSPVYNPSSPVYNPSSPVYNPSSPVYNPSSPVDPPSVPKSSIIPSSPKSSIVPKSPTISPKTSIVPSSPTIPSSPTLVPQKTTSPKRTVKKRKIKEPLQSFEDI